MKIYHFGAEDAPVLLLLPGTCCHWKSNFGAVIPLLADSFRVLCVSYVGFDETEQTEFPTMLEALNKDEKKALEEMEGSDNFKPNTSIKEKIFKKFKSLFD